MQAMLPTMMQVIVPRHHDAGYSTMTQVMVTRHHEAAVTILPTIYYCCGGTGSFYAIKLASHCSFAIAMKC
jgi:hypothetical protein